jgi:hypothetical protein
MGFSPPMPIHSAPDAAFVVYTVLSIITTAGVLAWWWFSSERARGPALPLLLLGGALCTPIEALVDNAVLIWWPPDQQLVVFRAWGRAIPLFIPFIYAWFCGGLPYFFARMCERGVTPRLVWRLTAVIFVVDFVAVGACVWLNLLGYYGRPPLAVAGYPLWWFSVDAVLVICGGAAVYLLEPRLHGAQKLYLVLVPPIAYAGAIGAVGWPIAVALNSQASGAVKTLAGLATIGLAAALIQLVAHLLPATRAGEASPVLGGSRL